MNNFIYHIYYLQLEDYGLIMTWTANKNVNFIMETDIDHITSFLITVMQGQYYINNGLLLTRIQCIYTILYIIYIFIHVHISLNILI